MESALKLEKTDKILFLGEGNFSFSKSFVELQEAAAIAELGTQIYATCFQGEEEDSTDVRQNNISYLKQHNVNIFHKVDARKIHEHKTLKSMKFTKVVFMFPHVGGKMKINLNRELLQAVFQSVQQVLDHNKGILLITLCAGQGGSPFETKIRRNDDTWKILEISQDAGFVLANIFNFEPKLFAEYCQVGYRSQQKGFHVEDSVVHIFKYKPLPCLQPIHSMEDNSNMYLLKSYQEAKRQQSNQLYPLVHEHHLSFWCRNNQLISTAKMNAVVQFCLGDIPHNICQSDNYKTDEGDLSQTIAVTYKSNNFPLGPKQAFHLHNKVFGQSLCNIFKVELR